MVFPADLVNNMVEQDPTLENQRTMLEAWRSLASAHPDAKDAELQVCATVEQAVTIVEGLGGDLASDGPRTRTRALVTGSLHLIGACLTVLNAEVV